MYMLEGGPRDGQLVDELPTGYIHDGRTAEPMDLFDGYTAERGIWSAGRSRMQVARIINPKP